MLSIQTAGSQILTDNPGPFYIFIGNEYGVKYKYLAHLFRYYGKCTEFDTMAEVMSIMRTKHFPPLTPQLYIVRYDDSFLTSGISADDINKLKIIGTVVCVYESDRAAKKCEKQFPEYTVPFDAISQEYIRKYLRNDYPDLPDGIIDSAVKFTDNYMSAYHICQLISYIQDVQMISRITDAMIGQSFGTIKPDVDKQLRYAFAAKNYSSCIHILDNYTGSKESIFYVMLSTLLDLEKLLTSKQKSDLSRYVSDWDISSVYNMFGHVYADLQKSRNLTGYNVYDRLVYLFSLMQYAPIPALGVV